MFKIYVEYVLCLLSDSTLRGVSVLTPWVSDLPFRLVMTALEQPDYLGVAKTLRLAERGVSPSVRTIKGNLHTVHTVILNTATESGGRILLEV
jgi:hypothetical protein